MENEKWEIKNGKSKMKNETGKNGKSKNEKCKIKNGK